MADRKASPLSGSTAHPAWGSGDSGATSAPKKPLEVVPPVAPPAPVVEPVPAPPVEEPKKPAKPVVKAPSEPPKRPKAPSKPKAVAPPAAPVHHGGRGLDWTIHSRQLRAGLLAWASARDKVEERAGDVREHLRVAGAEIPDDHMLRIAEMVADQTGYPLVEVLEAAGLARDA